MMPETLRRAAAARKQPAHPGLIGTLKKPAPPRDPAKDFMWPHRASDEQKLAFRAALSELLRERNESYIDLSCAIFGVKPFGASPRVSPIARLWVQGRAFPEPEFAPYIAHHFKVPLSRLMSPKGPLVELPLTRIRRNLKGNGADGPPTMKRKYAKKGKHEEPQLLPLPESAPKMTLKFELWQDDPRFAVLDVHGVVQLEEALSAVALLHRQRR